MMLRRPLLISIWMGFSISDAFLHLQVQNWPQQATFSLTSLPLVVKEEESLTADLMAAPHDSAFTVVAGRTAVCLLESDIRRDAIGKAAGIQASSATNWINDESAFALQAAITRLQLKLPEQRTGVDRDEAAAWLRWLKSVPAPSIVDLSDDLRSIVSATLPDYSLERIDQKREQFLARIGCRLILLPSGAELQSPLTEPTASIVYGKLLYGGATRYRLLISSNSRSAPRQAGVRTEVKAKVGDKVPTWMMYGGPDRMYEAVDMGPCAVLEVLLLPRGKELERRTGSNMFIGGLVWKPNNMFCFEGELSGETNGEAAEIEVNGYSPSSLSGRERNNAFRSDFQTAVGGLQSQIDAIVRRVLDGRVIRPAEVVDAERQSEVMDDTTRQLSVASMEAEELALLGLTPVRGLLLYGPPGCGKTALAREISRALRARTPKIVAAPELLDRWVGGSEKAVRALFADAEAELAACNGDASKSALHIVVIDEIDAVFRKRSSSEDTGEATRSSVVNQILAKLDGVNAAPNLLLIGMTNRRELLDPALLRPGRLEVQIEIPLPDREGRREILKIHFGALRQRGRLSQPLCCAIDGVPYTKGSLISTEEDDSSAERLETSPEPRRRKRDVLKQALAESLPGFGRSYYDLASDAATGGFSGADIAGLVRCAGSLALSRARRDGSGVDGLLITLDDVKQALLEVKR